MILIGMFDSSFMRRVAVSMDVLGVPFEHRAWSVGRDFDRIRDFSPLGRVPVLVLDDGETLSDSAAILDYLDGLVGPERALLPAHGPARRQAQRLMGHAIGAVEKAISQVMERVFRPDENTTRLGSTAVIRKCAALLRCSNRPVLRPATASGWWAKR